MALKAKSVCPESPMTLKVQKTSDVKFEHAARTLRYITQSSELMQSTRVCPSSEHTVSRWRAGRSCRPGLALTSYCACAQKASSLGVPLRD